MDAERFDRLVKGLGAGTDRRRVLGMLAGSLAAVLRGQTARAQGGNEACDTFCHTVFAGRAAGHCTAAAVRGEAGNLCAACGADPTRVCVGADGEPTCDCCTAEKCTEFPNSFCDEANGSCQCAPNKTCPEGQRCGTASDGCGSTIPCRGCDGCCTGETCLAASQQNAATCGTGGNPCAACGTCETCGANGCEATVCTAPAVCCPAGTNHAGACGRLANTGVCAEHVECCSGQCFLSVGAGVACCPTCPDDCFCALLANGLTGCVGSGSNDYCDDNFPCPEGEVCIGICVTPCDPLG